MTAFATIISKQAVVVCPFFENIRHMCARLNWFFAGRRCVFLFKRGSDGQTEQISMPVHRSPTQERMAEALLAVWESRQNFLHGINLRQIAGKN